MSGGVSTQKLTMQFRAALADPTIKVIVFDFDSPGGGVEGVPELAEEIFKSRDKKKTVAVVNSLCASAAYWLASAAEELVITPSGQAGSIGVFAAHEDFSAALDKAGVKVSLISAGKYKTEGNPYEPLSLEAKQALQEKVDAFYSMFVKAVSKGRGVSQAAVRDGFGQGRLLIADQCIKERMADSIGTLDDTLARVAPGAAPKRMSAAAAQASIDAGAPEDPDNEPDQDPDDVLNESSTECECECLECSGGNCGACTNAQCVDEQCSKDGCPMQEKARLSSKAKASISRRRRDLELHRH
jgi:signal peptide peptidase SppA